MKKYLILIIIFFLTGCSSYIELNDLAIIDTISIQKEDNNYKLTISYIEEIEENNLNPQTKIIETKDTNINQLFNDLSLKINKKIYLSHLNLFLTEQSSHISTPHLTHRVLFSQVSSVLHILQ